MTVELFDFGDGVPPRRAQSDPPSENRVATSRPEKAHVGFDQPRLFELANSHSASTSDRGPEGPVRSNDSEAQAEPHTSIAGKPRTAVRGFSLVLAVVGHALIGSLIAAGGHLVLGAVASVAVMSCSAALVATEALASQ